MSDGPEHSPALLPPPPKRGPGVRRLNRVPLYAGLAAAALVVGSVVYTYQERAAREAESTRESR